MQRKNVEVVYSEPETREVEEHRVSDVLHSVIESTLDPEPPKPDWGNMTLDEAMRAYHARIEWAKRNNIPPCPNCGEYHELP